MIELRGGINLYQVTEYKLITAERKIITIQVLKDVTGRSAVKYIALPVMDVQIATKDSITGEGESEEHAVQDLLDQLERADIARLFRSPSGDTGAKSQRVSA